MRHRSLRCPSHILIPISFAEALPRSKLVALRRKHLRRTPHEMVPWMTWSKTDDGSEDVGIPHSPTWRN